AVVVLVAVAPPSIATVPVGAVVSVTTGAATVMLSDLLPLFGVPWLSVTVAVNVKLPVLVGVPAMRPVEAVSVRPSGRLPEVTLQVYGAVPELTESVWLYGVPVVASGSD